ncbi:MAG: leucyl aminopeptidase [Chloroflexi bacterium]|nr:MAG: leucyl aminopeptidase [Chloroflexota bacterium]
MEIKAVAASITEVPFGAVVVNLFEGVKEPGGATGAVDEALDGAITSLIADGEIKGKKGELTLIHTLGKLPSARVVIVGLGKQADFNAEVVREVTASSSRYLRKLGIAKGATITHGAGIGGLDPEASAQAMAEGAYLGLYTFKKYFSKKDDDAKTLDEFHLVEQDAAKLPALQAGIERGRIVAEAALLARDLVNEPASVMTPTKMSEVAQEVAQQHGLEVEILDTQRMEELGMGMLLAVAKGSHQPPKMIVLRYLGDPDNADNNLGLVGKGITFDSGGISLKSAGGMWEMKGDMSGAASVIGAMQAIAQLKPRLNVTAIAPCTENMPGGSAQRPGDVIKAMNGKTAEVDNTDAEGRLILADALSYARSLNLKRLVDVATLTGAISIALGDQAIGGFTNNQALYEKVAEAGAKAGERIWQLPMYPEYKDQIKSDIADVKNTGGRGAGSITAALFLAEFSEDTPWVHLDIAGTFMSSKEKGYKVKGATGTPVRTLVNLALDLGG